MDNHVDEKSPVYHEKDSGSNKKYGNDGVPVSHRYPYHDGRGRHKGQQPQIST